MKNINLDDFSLSQLEKAYFSLGDYEIKPVGIQEFIKNPYYLGLSFVSNSIPGEGIYPYWVKVLKEIYPSPIYSPYWLIALRGSIGIGKTTIAAVVTAYEIYLLLCLKSPQIYHNLMPDTRIVVSVFNIILSLATNVTWDSLSSLFLKSQYFREQLNITSEDITKIKRDKDRNTLFPKRIDISIGSRIQHNLGQAVCLSGDTVVPLLDGRNVKIKDLVDNFNNCYVYSIDIENSLTVPGKIINTFSTGINKVYKITLDNNKEFKCTSNHLILMRDGSYKSIDSGLRIADAIFPFNLFVDENDLYKKIKDPFTGEIKKVHHLVSESLGFSKKLDVHHKDFNKWNNNPYNLISITKKTILKYFVSLEKFEDCVRNYNLKIINIEYVGEEETFDLTIDKYHNFALSAGSVVHNCLNIFDEAAFGIVTDQVSKAFQSAIRRIQSRFGASEDGILRGKILLISSENDKLSELNSILNQYKNYPGVYISRPAIWEVKTSFYSKETFPIFIGSDNKQPEIIHKDNEILLSTDSDRIINAPVSIKREFETNLHEALRDLAGVSTSNSYKLFRLRDRIHNCMTMTQLFPEIVTVDFDSTNENVIFNSCLFPDYFNKPFYSNKPRHVHIDIGIVNDYLGIACCYVPEFYQRDVKELTEEFNSAYEVLIKMNVDFAFACKPQSGKRLPLHRIREFLYYLKNQLNYPIMSVSFDSFQSEESLQLLKKAGFKTQLLSVDKTMIPYINLRTAVYENRVILPINELLKNELFNLEVSADSKKIDHPKIADNGNQGSKDVADCLAGCYQYLTDNISDYRMYENMLNPPTDEEIEKARYEVNGKFQSEDEIGTINDFFRNTLK